MEGTSGGLHKGRKDLLPPVVGGRAQQNGMGFGNKNLLGEKKGRSWCLLLMLRGLNIGPMWEGLSHYYKPLFPFCPE